MDFSDGLKTMRVERERIRRKGWNGKGMFLFIIRDWNYANQITGLFPNLPFIAMKTADNSIVPWLASQTDLLADDWEIVPDSE